MLILVLSMAAFRSAVADWNDVPTGSMKPTILEGDRVVVNKLAYDLKVPFSTWHLARWDEPRRGDIVVFFSPHDGTRLIKRVAGVPGDVIQLRDRRLNVNGEPVQYAPLPSAIRDQIAVAEQPAHEFALEKLPGREHAVMTTPGANSPQTIDSVTVPAGCYFMLGDNRDNSFDSRYFGCVPRRSIVGQAVGVALSVGINNRWAPRWHRFFSPL